MKIKELARRTKDWFKNWLTRIWAYLDPAKGWSKQRKTLDYVVFIILVILLVGSWTVFKSERIIERQTVIEKPAAPAPPITKEVVPQALQNKIVGLEAENANLKQQVASLDNEVVSLRKQKEDYVNQVTKLNKEIEDYKKASVSKLNIPAVPAVSELVSWTDVEAKALMRLLYPGNDKYRDPAFLNGMVYPVSWYESILPSLPQEVVADEWPTKLIAWFDTRYDDIITGYAWVNESGVWRTVKVVPAHQGKTIGIYYVVGRTLIKAGSQGDKITPYVRAINLLR